MSRLFFCVGGGYLCSGGMQGSQSRTPPSSHLHLAWPHVGHIMKGHQSVQAVREGQPCRPAVPAAASRVRNRRHQCRCYTEKATALQRPGIASNDNTTHVPTARSSADLTKPKHPPKRHTRAEDKIILRMATPQAAASHRTHVSRVPGPVCYTSICVRHSTRGAPGRKQL